MCRKLEEKNHSQVTNVSKQTKPVYEAAMIERGITVIIQVGYIVLPDVQITHQ